LPNEAESKAKRINNNCFRGTTIALSTKRSFPIYKSGGGAQDEIEQGNRALDNGDYIDA
jgi:hypothetical protein